MASISSETMLERARAAAKEAKIYNVQFKRADAEQLPIKTSSVDVALVNGIFNLNPSRELIFRKLVRVLRPRGKAYAAELILAGPLLTTVTQTLEDAAVSRVTKLVEEAHSKLAELATERSRVSAGMQRTDQQKDATQDSRERKVVEDEVLPQLKQHLRTHFQGRRAVASKEQRCRRAAQE